jgi:hypothetical protein
MSVGSVLAADPRATGPGRDGTGRGAGSMRHDGSVLIQVEGLTRSPDDVALVEVRTSVGTVAARWCGGPEVAPGAHHVEWELDEEFRWGLNCSQVELEEPYLSQNERWVVFRGRLGLVGTLSVPMFAHLELADAVIDLGHIDALPDGMAGSWVEVRLEPEKIKIYPYLV